MARKNPSITIADYYFHNDGSLKSDYLNAVNRWEKTTRSCPETTFRDGKGTHRVSIKFIEWTMGLPDGLVSEVEGLPRRQMVKMLGNGVVPQQAELALEILTQDLD